MTFDESPPPIGMSPERPYHKEYGGTVFICHTVRVENFKVFLISRFSWVPHHTKIIRVEGRIREIF